MQIVTLKKNTLIRHFIFLLILAIGFGTVVISQNTHTEMTEVKLYYVDAQMLRLISRKNSNTADEYAENGTKSSGRAC